MATPPRQMCGEARRSCPPLGCRTDGGGPSSAGHHAESHPRKLVQPAFPRCRGPQLMISTGFTSWVNDIAAAWRGGMADATGETKEPLRIAFDRHLKLGFHGARVISDGGLLAYRELDDALGLTATAAFPSPRAGAAENTLYRLLGLLRQAV